MTTPKILLVQEDESLRALLKHALESQGCRVEALGRGEATEEYLKTFEPDLLILESSLPLFSSFALRTRLRKQPDTRNLPVLIILSEGEIGNGRDLKATTTPDDFIRKPFSMPEFLARVRTFLRRVKPEVLVDVLVVDDVILDKQQHQIIRNGRKIHLGITEYNLLEFLMENPRKAISRQQLMDSVWNNAVDLDGRVVDVYILRLRKALRIAGETDIISTIRGVGYSIGS